jgi:hypothetical protein
MRNPDPFPNRHRSPFSLFGPQGLPSQAYVRGVGHYDPDDDPELREFMWGMLGRRLDPWPVSQRSEQTRRYPVGNRSDAGNRGDRSSHEWLQCLTCGRALTVPAQRGYGVVCPDHGRLVAGVLPFRPFRHCETVWIVAAVSHRSLLVARVADGKRHRVALRNLGLLTMDDWQWNPTGSEHHERG